ncbi:unnamed protein product [Caenorhabditis brenneri]
MEVENGGQMCLSENLEVTDHYSYENQFHDLLVRFIYEMNLPFETVENPILKEMIHHLNPNVSLPTAVELMTPFDEQGKQEEAEKEEEEEEEVAFCSREFFDQSTEHEPPLDLAKLPSPEEMNAVYNGTDRSFCMVCLEWKDHSKVRKLCLSEVPIILFACFAEGVHTMEIAQELYSCRIHKSCISHFIPVVKSLMKHLRIKSTKKLVRVPKTADIVIFPVVQSIRNVPINTETGVQDRKTLGTFRMQLQRFITKFGFSDRMDHNIVFVPPKPMKHISSSEYPLGSANTSQSDFPDDFLEL